MFPVKVALLVFLAVVLAMRSFTAKSEKEREEIAERVRKFTRETLIEEKDEKGSYRSPLVRIAALSRVFTPKRILEQVEADLVKADIPLKPEEMVGMRIAAAFIPAFIGLAFFGSIVLSFTFGMIGAYPPVVYLKSAKGRRAQKFNDQLGDALSIMANSLRAGFSFLQTMDSLSKEMAPPMSTEFSRALREMRLGTTTEEALHNMSKRIQSEDLELIVTAVNIQRQVGGNLAQILDNIAFTIKERVRIKAEVKTLTAQGRISGTIVALLPVFLAVAISVMNPPYMGLLLTHKIGFMLIGGALASETIGILVIKKIVNIEY